MTESFRLGQPRNDEVAEGGLNYQQQGPPWCGVERERREEEREVCVLLGNSANSLCSPQTDGLVSLRSSPNREKSEFPRSLKNVGGSSSISKVVRSLNNVAPSSRAPSNTGPHTALRPLARAGADETRGIRWKPARDFALVAPRDVWHGPAPPRASCGLRVRLDQLGGRGDAAQRRHSLEPVCAHLGARR
jgi:hypothetical protein